jgi:hypothetical protein
MRLLHSRIIDLTGYCMCGAAQHFAALKKMTAYYNNPFT